MRVFAKLILTFMKNYHYLSRQERIDQVLAHRKEDLVLVLEDLSEEHNISAILRTAEGFGISKVFIIHSLEKKPKLSSNVSSGASKWLKIEYSTSAVKCLENLRNEGFSIYGTYVNPSAQSLWETKFEGKVALVMGNEAHGISDNVIKLSDHIVYLPMQGLTESFNVSVASALFIYEIVRQKYTQEND